MKRNKGIVLVGTIVVVLLGLFLGFKVINKPGNKVGKNTNNTKVAKEDKKNKEQNDNFLSQSLREEKERKEEDKELKQEKNTDTLSEEELKENTREEKEKKEEEGSKTTNAKGIEVYDDKYVVKNGDTLFNIATQYFHKDNVNKAVQLIKEINKMDNKVLIKAGDKLLIPTEDNLKEEKQRKTENIEDEHKEKDVEEKEIKENKRDIKDGKETSSKGKAYIVKKGDNLTKIVKENMNWCTNQKAIKILMEHNELKNANDIKENQKIYIPLQK